MVGFMAIYKDGLLYDLMYLKNDIDANDSHRFWLGTKLPDDGHIKVKLYVWNSFDSLTPLLESALFETIN